jgi:ADP-heptose:LPS heptosyltransferase
MDLDLKVDNTQDEFLWHEAGYERQFKGISNTMLRGLGINDRGVRTVDKIEDLRESPPNIVIAEAVRNISFIQNFFKVQQLKKKSRYVMGLGVYQQLHFDESGKRKILKPANVQFKKFYRPYIGQNLDDEELLVFRTGGIGDLLFIQPNLIYLKEKYPDSTINFACGPQYQAMVDNWLCIDNLLDLPFSLKSLTDASYHALFEGVIERCKEAHTKNAYNLFSEWLGLNLPDELLIPRQEAKPKMIQNCQNVLRKEWGGLENFILMQLRASSPIRTPRPQFWANMITKLVARGHSVVLTDTPRQAESIETFRKELDDKTNASVYNFAPFSETLDYTIALAKLAKLVVATDSALNHIAASLNTPCYGIYGPFPGFIRLKTYPYADWVDAQRHCAPCFLHGHRPCQYAGKDGYSPCYDNIDLDESIDRMEKILK